MGGTDYLIITLPLHAKTTERLTINPGECNTKGLGFVAKILLKVHQLKYATV